MKVTPKLNKEEMLKRLMAIQIDTDLVPEWQTAMKLDSKDGWEEYAHFLEELISDGLDPLYTDLVENLQ